jgi:iron complex transport system ATP-binding protein
VSHRLEARDLRVRLGAGLVLDGVNCSFGRGWTAVVGPNGAGKSTLLRALAGLLPLAGGQVLLDGQALQDLEARQRGQRIAWLAQLGDASGELNVGETVALGRLPHLGLLGTAGNADHQAIERAMSITECGSWRHRLLTELSGGERQRVLLARALATEASVLLLDEPTTHLDPPHQVAIARLARSLAATHTVVTVLHDLPLALHADQLLVLQKGRVLAAASHDDPALHAAMGAVFGGAVRIERQAGRPHVVPALEP